MTCKECLYYEACEHFNNGDAAELAENAVETKCPIFKDKSRYIETPCKVGDTVYCIEHKTIRECLVKMVKSLTYDENGTKYFVEAECEIESPFYSDGRKIKHGLMAVWEIEWGSWYRAFPTREEAEKALAERRADNVL